MKRILFVVGMLVMSMQAADRGWKLPPETTQLKRGPGVEAAMGQCLLCHSADYISIQPTLNRAAWTATVTKMREKYGAPIQTNQIEAVVNYLVTNYGAEKSAPAK